MPSSDIDAPLPDDFDATYVRWFMVGRRTFAAVQQHNGMMCELTMTMCRALFGTTEPAARRAALAAGVQVPSSYLEAMAKYQKGMNEVDLLERVGGHPGVIKIKAVLEHVETRSVTIMIVMQLAHGGELFDHVANNGGPLPEAEAMEIFQQLVSVVAWLHRRGVAHRDLKLDNCLVDGTTALTTAAMSGAEGVAAGVGVAAGRAERASNNASNASTAAPGDHAPTTLAVPAATIGDIPRILLCDFGLSLGVVRGDGGGGLATKRVGTTGYWSPEIWRRRNAAYDPFSADIWALGVILYVMVTGHPPFEESPWTCQRYKLYEQHVTKRRQSMGPLVHPHTHAAAAHAAARAEDVAGEGEAEERGEGGVCGGVTSGGERLGRRRTAPAVMKTKEGAKEGDVATVETAAEKTTPKPRPMDVAPKWFVPEEASPAVKALIASMMCVDATERIDIAGVQASLTSHWGLHDRRPAEEAAVDAVEEAVDATGAVEEAAAVSVVGLADAEVGVAEVEVAGGCDGSDNNAGGPDVCGTVPVPCNVEGKCDRGEEGEDATVAETMVVTAAATAAATVVAKALVAIGVLQPDVGWEEHDDDPVGYCGGMLADVSITSSDDDASGSSLASIASSCESGAFSNAGGGGGARGAVGEGSSRVGATMSPRTSRGPRQTDDALVDMPSPRGALVADEEKDQGVHIALTSPTSTTVVKKAARPQKQVGPSCGHYGQSSSEGDAVDYIIVEAPNHDGDGGDGSDGGDGGDGRDGGDSDFSAGEWQRQCLRRCNSAIRREQTEAETGVGWMTRTFDIKAIRNSLCQRFSWKRRGVDGGGGETSEKGTGESYIGAAEGGDDTHEEDRRDGGTRAAQRAVSTARSVVGRGPFSNRGASF